MIKTENVTYSYSAEDGKVKLVLDGINIEREHGNANPSTNVTNDDLLVTAQIALAHLNEFPNYYNKYYGIKMFEEFLKKQQKRLYL